MRNSYDNDGGMKNNGNDTDIPVIIIVMQK